MSESASASSSQSVDTANDLAIATVLQHEENRRSRRRKQNWPRETDDVKPEAPDQYPTETETEIPLSHGTFHEYNHISHRASCEYDQKSHSHRTSYEYGNDSHRASHEYEHDNRTSPVNYEIESDEEIIRCILLGKTGAGKTSTVKSLMYNNRTDESIGHLHATSISTKRTISRLGNTLSFIDTPGFLNTEVSTEKIAKELLRALGLASPGPHIFLLVFNGASCFTKEDENTINRLKNCFGEEMMEYSIIVVTRTNGILSEYANLKDYAKNSVHAFRKLAAECEYRIIGMDNKNPSVQQEDDLFHMVTKLKFERSSYFTIALLTCNEAALHNSLSAVHAGNDLEYESQGHPSLSRNLNERSDLSMQLEKNTAMLEKIHETLLNQNKERHYHGIIREIIERVCPMFLRGIITRMVFWLIGLR